MSFLLHVLLWATAVQSVTIARRAKNPTISGTPEVVGFVSDPSLDRDSCGSALFGKRLLWTCRDTEVVGQNGIPTIPVMSSTASWTDFNSDGSPKLQAIPNDPDDPLDYGLLMYGDNNILASQPPFYPQIPGQCINSAGGCPDNSRYPMWPDSPPMVLPSSNPSTSIVAYTWITQSHIATNLTQLPPIDPATTLYRLDYTSSSNNSSPTLPKVTIVSANFWPASTFPYGVYGNLIYNSTAYLFAKSSQSTISLARVPATSSAIEDPTHAQYEFFINNTWLPLSSSLPSSSNSSNSSTPSDGLPITTPGASLPNASAGGQGTYFYSPFPAHTSSHPFLWIGQPANTSVPNFWITSAPSPEGPWNVPSELFRAEAGNGTFGGYSLQVHPGLSQMEGEEEEEGGKEVWVTYTRTDSIDGVGYYATPLIRAEWAS
ncbi:MAG: hypothetical protein Q9227_000216 [Pyrenula ochraceoflavens]